MADDCDQVLICGYVRGRSEQAFSKLVHRYVDLVHSTALRIVRDAGLAEDVTQRVFVALAQHATKLQGRSSLTGWLHETARNLAINTVRSEERRRQREQEAAAMKHPDANDPQAQWQQIAPFLDDALAQLSAAERELILWRYFERRTAEQIAGRLGLTAEAAQKRVSRALDRLRGIFAERGLSASVSGIAAVLSVQAVQSAPAGLAASVLAAASATNAALPATSILHILMASTKAKMALAAVMAASLATPVVLQHQKTSRLMDELAVLQQRGPELDRLRAEVERLTTEAHAAARERDKERAELTRLGGQLTTLTSAGTKPVVAPKGPPGAGPSKESETSKPAGERLARANWRNVGFEVPSLTVQTIEWAKVNGETNVIANGLAWGDEESRNQIDALFAAAPEAVKTRYGSADAYIMSLFNHSGPTDDRHTLTSFRILEEKISGDDATLTVEYNYADGNTYVSPQQYVRLDNAWRQTLDFGAPEQGKLGAALQAEGGAVDASGSGE
jgi:RNA polymerase sigma factor (sigma-70 family)